AVEAELGAVAGRQVAEGAAGAAVVVVDLHLVAARTEPPGEEIGVGVGPEHLLRRRVELPGDPDEGEARVGGDLGLAVAGHVGAPVSGGGGAGTGSMPSGRSRSRSSRRR